MMTAQNSPEDCVTCFKIHYVFAYICIYIYKTVNQVGIIYIYICLFIHKYYIICKTIVLYSKTI